QLGNSEGIADRQVRHVYGNVRRNVARKALDLDLAGDEVEDPALGLDADGDADDLDGDLDPDPGGHLDPDEVDVEGFPGDRVLLEVLDHDVAGQVGPGHLEQEDRVFPRSPAESVGEGLAVHADGDRGLLRAVDDGRDPSLRPGTAGLVLPFFL